MSNTYDATKVQEPEYSGILRNCSRCLVNQKIEPVVNPTNLAHIVETYKNGSFIWVALAFNMNFDSGQPWNDLLTGTIIKIDPALGKNKEAIRRTVNIALDLEDDDTYSIEGTVFRMLDYMQAYGSSEKLETLFSRDERTVENYVTSLLLGTQDIPYCGPDLSLSTVGKAMAETPWLTAAIADLEKRSPDRVLWEG